MFAYALTIFLGAFLLFQVQPLIGKYILPWFGGGPGVWTTCMLFFQMLLLGGYAYAHFLSQKLKPRAQAVVHLALLLAAVALLPITPTDAWKPDGQGNPVRQILALLIVCLGLPYFMLSSTGPLMQQWFSRTNPGISPYRLYALSNVGSLLALVSYPFYFETHFTRIAQARMWGAGLITFVLACGWCAFKLWNAKPQVNPAFTTESPGSPGRETAESTRAGAVRLHTSAVTRLLWLLLPACASVLLLAITNKLCQDVAVIPFLWVLPLALYLLSFVICFDNPRWYAREPFAFLLVAALAAICWGLFKGLDAPLNVQVGIYTGALFIFCMVCHGELYRLRPDPRQLTGFYLMIAAGGALGGVFVAAVAPKIFTDYYELNWGLLLCGLLFLLVYARARGANELKPQRRLACVAMLVACGVIHLWLLWKSKDSPNWLGIPIKELQVNLWLLFLVATAYWLDPKPRRWLAYMLTLAAFTALDQAVSWLGQQYPTQVGGRVLQMRIAMWSILALVAGVWALRGRFRKFQHWHLLSCAWLSLGLMTLAGLLWHQVGSDEDKNVLSRSRNFYGTLKVCEYHKNEPESHYLLLQHGRITHGIQFVDPASAMMPTSYYAKGSGVEKAVNTLPTGARRIGVVGLGTGSMAVFGRAGDFVHIYEINRDVERLATSRFTYLSNCPAKVEVTMGDARLSMEREAPQNYDLLALDAFSSDAIPVHLLTKEALALYGRHMKTNGIIAVHISNRYLNLEPVVANLARDANYKMAVISHDEDDEFDENDEWWVYSSTWVLLTHSEEVINARTIADAANTIKTNQVNIPLWTDDFASVFQILQ